MQADKKKKRAVHLFGPVTYYFHHESDRDSLQLLSRKRESHVIRYLVSVTCGEVDVLLPDVASNTMLFNLPSLLGLSGL